MHGLRDPSGAEPGTGEGKRDGKGRRRDSRRGGGRTGIYVVKEKRQGSAARAFPNRAAAKPGGSNRTTEITYNSICKHYLNLALTMLKAACFVTKLRSMTKVKLHYYIIGFILTYY
jgi:hypothetical protein